MPTKHAFANVRTLAPTWWVIPTFLSLACDRSLIPPSDPDPEPLQRVAPRAAFHEGETCTPAPAGLVGWWPGDGDATDLIGGNHGSVIGGAGFTSPGKVGDAFTVSGSGTDYFRIPDDPALEPAAITVDAWVRAGPGSPGTHLYVVAKGVEDCFSSSYALYTGPSGGLVFYVGAPSQIVNHPILSPAAGSQIWDGEWHHVAGTYDGSHVRLYVDGAEIGNGSQTNLAIGYGMPTHDDLLIGQVGGTCSLPFNGDIDEVEIFDRALSPAEIQAIHTAGSAGKCRPADTPEEILGAILAKVEAFLADGSITDPGIARSLRAKLEGALAALERGNPKAARNKLEAFVHHVEAQKGKKISAEAAEELLDLTTQLMDEL